MSDYYFRYTQFGWVFYEPPLMKTEVFFQIYPTCECVINVKSIDLSTNFSIFQICKIDQIFNTCQISQICCVCHICQICQIFKSFTCIKSFTFLKFITSLRYQKSVKFVKSIKVFKYFKFVKYIWFDKSKMSNFLNLSKFSIRHSGQSYHFSIISCICQNSQICKKKLSNFTYQLDLLNLHIRLF